MILPGGLLFLLLMSPSAQQGNGATAPPASPRTADATAQSDSDNDQNDGTGDLPVSLKRIRRALAERPALKVLEPQEPQEMRNGRPVFRVDVEREKIDIQAILGKESLLRGAVPYGGMTHQEFLDLVTPNDVKGYAAFSNGQGAIVAATSIALQWALQKALDTYKKAKDAREREAARKEVDEALEALRKARRAAGLPEK